MSHKIILSTLGHTWLIDLDGTLVKHNGYKLQGFDTLLDGSLEFLNSIPKEDMIILITARKEEYRELTEAFLRDNGIKYSHIIFNAPYGERILINDRKVSGLNTAIAINTERDDFDEIILEVNESL